MALYVNGQEKKCFVNGQQQSGYVNGVKVFCRKKGLSFTGTQFFKVNHYIPLPTDIITCTALQRFTSVLSAIWSSRRSLGTPARSLWGNVDVRPRFDYLGDNNASLRQDLPFDTICKVISEANKWYVNNTLIYTAAESDLSTDSGFQLGAIDNGVQRLNGIIYDFNVITAQGNTKIDMVPVPEGSTLYSTTPAPSNCFWDTVTQQYFENQGTGTLEYV